jgi:tagatose 1,6-diphosphate aldolase
VKILASPGKWSGLKRVSNVQNVFTIVAFDQRGSYVKMLQADASHQLAVSIKRDVVNGLSPYASAILLDPEYGIAPAYDMHRNCGLLMALEKSGYSGDSTYRHTEMYLDWTVENIKNIGASVVKVLVYYNPEAGDLAEEIEELSRQVAQQCIVNDIAYFLEPVTYSIDVNVPKSSQEFAEMRPEIISETARRLGATGPDVLKLEFPIDTAFDDNRSNWRKACEDVSAASPVPWVLLSAGVDFDVFEQQVEVACLGGASGFLGGRAIWKETIKMSQEARQAFLAEEGIRRLQKLIDVSNKHARPWTDFFEPAPIEENWFSEYGKV